MSVQWQSLSGYLWYKPGGGEVKAVTVKKLYFVCVKINVFRMISTGSVARFSPNFSFWFAKMKWWESCSPCLVSGTFWTKEIVVCSASSHVTPRDRSNRMSRLTSRHALLVWRQALTISSLCCKWTVLSPNGRLDHRWFGLNVSLALQVPLCARYTCTLACDVGYISTCSYRCMHMYEL